jgi:hypothetical protein
MSNLLKEAIADAKAVRATALANAKAALEEAFNTKAEAMLAEKLKQEIAADEAVSSSEIGSGGVGSSHAPDKGAVTHQNPQGGPKVVPFEEAEGHMGETIEEEGGEETVTNEEIDEILKELEAELEEGGEEPAPAAPVAAAPAAPVAAAPEAPVAAAPEAPVAPAVEEPTAQVGEEIEEEIDLNELLASLEEGEIEEGEIEEGKKEGKEDEEEKGKEKTDEAVYAELQEAYKVVEYLRNQLSEINLLNSKLLYTNKLFNTFNLTKEQKTKVVETFDLAKSIREVKLSYAILSESYSSGGSVVKKSNTTAKTITEGLASKPVASTAPAKEVIVENSNVMASRFQKLAGIKK